ncbi:MAG: 30S ribosomal protein S12 methylthiotransferase RimO [Verrucomicrobium sp.]|nr:30S ribosomal protein S12 methylthiotransferase RimO [Verrucomicrobium sp.]
MKSPLPEPPAAAAEATVKVGLISLGCAKNLVDSEIMIGHLHQAGMAMTPDAAEADVLIVNTCSFIDESKEESIEAIFEANRDRGMHRRRGGQKLIVAGCMAQRFSKQLPKLMPEVDAFIGLDQITKVAPIIEGLLGKEKAADAPENFVTPNSRYIPDYDTPRFRLTPQHSAYVKIAEGCNHPCAFCIIPQIRGRHRSRSIASIVEEVRRLAAAGVKEFNLISQDTTYFGMDRWEEKAGPRQKIDSTRGETLCDLLRALQAVEGDFWIRLLYTHPAHWSDELIETIAQCDKVARYVDMPLQHISQHMLEAMRRETSEEYVRDLVARIRKGIPGVTLRTTFIVGFPGETEDDFQTLLGFIKETEFDRLGVFRYSQEEGTRAAKMEEQLPEPVKKARWNQAMALQRDLAESVGERFVGRRLRVLVEKPGIGRTQGDAPEVDGQVILSGEAPVSTFVEVEVTGCRGYDLLAKVI